jgi:hypothetical protein
MRIVAASPYVAIGSWAYNRKTNPKTTLAGGQQAWVNLSKAVRANGCQSPWAGDVAQKKTGRG